MPDTVICAEGLSKNYGRHLGIDGVGIEVRRGEVFGYLGPNGAGKTTTIRILMDFIRADRGKAEVFGLDCRRDSVAIRRRVGFLPGNVRLYENLSGRDYLRFLASLRAEKIGERAEELAERLDCPLSRPIHSLSQGNKRKIGLIQAFMHRPELLVLDEPTSGLDPIVRHEFYHWIEEARAWGQTVFFSSHNLPEVERICDRVAIIRRGRIVATERIAELKARSLRSLEVRFAEDIDARTFAAVPGLEIVAHDRRTLKGRMKGEMDVLLKTMAKFQVTDFRSRDPDLEEVFLAYYGKDDHAP
ncbi:MAG: ABC transporter ATP-binding protein [Candidatus Aminicenantes bacterium]|nr:ABC transporter ATP-binding protein [Candidatus Aminicenantes bacterium]